MRSKLITGDSKLKTLNYTPQYRKSTAYPPPLLIAVRQCWSHGGCKTVLSLMRGYASPMPVPPANHILACDALHLFVPMLRRHGDSHARMNRKTQSYR